MDDFRTLPPVARTLTAIAFVESALVHSGTVSSFYVPFIPQLLLKFWPDVWRLGTSFLLTDAKLNFIFDLYFLYTYSSRLEFGSPRFTKPGSFLVYVLFIAFVIMLTAGFYLGTGIFTQALILAFAYTYSQDNKGTKTTFFVVEIPTLLLPWARLVLTFVRKGLYAASIEFTGIVAAHLYDFLTRIYPTFGGGKNYVMTPAFMTRWFTRSLSGGQERVYGRAFRPPNEVEQASSGWTSSVRNAWGSRGSGQRLGGN
ncbi:Der1-like family-domain-containing protein [Aspergillus californicus]